MSHLPVARMAVEDESRQAKRKFRPLLERIAEEMCAVFWDSPYKNDKATFMARGPVSEATLYRFRDHPHENEPKILTILAWVEASGFTLTEFFGRIEAIPVGKFLPWLRALESVDLQNLDAEAVVREVVAKLSQSVN